MKIYNKNIITKSAKCFMAFCFVVIFLNSCKKETCKDNFYPELSTYQKEYLVIQDSLPKFKVTQIDEFGFPVQLKDEQGKYEKSVGIAKVGDGCIEDIFGQGWLELKLNGIYIDKYLFIDNRKLKDTSSIGINFNIKHNAFFDSLKVNNKMYYKVLRINYSVFSPTDMLYVYFVKGIGFIYLESKKYKIELIP